MNEITVEHKPSADRIEKLGVYGWAIWEKEVSTFPWSYDEREICYFLAGDVTVSPKGGAPVRWERGIL